MEREKNMIIQITALECPSCSDVIFSRSNHDYRSCSCNGISIDGGLGDYFNSAWDHNLIDINEVKFYTLESKLTKKDFHNDYNFRIDKYGKHFKRDLESLFKVTKIETHKERYG
jgi:hypothetical protein